MDVRDLVKEWARGINIPQVRLDESRLKIFFLMDYVRFKKQFIINIWNLQNIYLQWKIFSRYDIDGVRDQLDDNGYLHEMIVYQIIDSGINSPILNKRELDYLNEKPNKSLFVSRIISAQDWKNLSPADQKYYIPKSMPSNIDFLSYFCLSDCGFNFHPEDFEKIDDPVGLYYILRKNPTYWELVDFEKSYWTVAYIPDNLAWLVLIQNSPNFAHKIAEIKNDRANGWFKNQFYSWPEINQHLLIGNNQLLEKRYLTSQYFLVEGENKRRQEEERRAEENRRRQEEIIRRAEEEEERKIQKQIDARERAKAEYEKNRILNLYNQALASGFAKSEFGKAIRFFGLSDKFTCDELTKAYRKKSITEHPDRGGTNERFQNVIHYHHLLEYICKQ